MNACVRYYSTKTERPAEECGTWVSSNGCSAGAYVHTHTHTHAYNTHAYNTHAYTHTCARSKQADTKDAYQ